MMSEPEDKITLETKRFYYSKATVNDPAITFECLFAALSELHSKANEIGWETKVLDPFGEWLRSAYSGAR